MYNIEIYENREGKSELKEYLRNLKIKNNKSSNIKFNKIVSYIRFFSEYGLEIVEPYIKHLEANIWELRPSRDRIFFCICRK